jgi:D-alanyl-D-alanine carboxypeptidase/D-alanyl-D-alanine-endopeptidase (penicillin-binding protein 4)
MFVIVGIIAGCTGAFGEQAKRDAAHERIAEVMARPALRNARWGAAFYDPATGEMLYALNAQAFFNPASAMKLFTAGTVYEALGADYRFRTPVYRTGAIENGVLKGDLVLRASGDLLLGGRVNPDGTVNLPATDHTYDRSPAAVPVSDDPLRSMREIADQIAALGIQRIEGAVIVDASLFREEADARGGTGDHVISPMMLNDNLIDIIVTPGKTPGEPAALKILPETPYLTVINNTVTVEKRRPSPAGGSPLIRISPQTLPQAGGPSQPGNLPPMGNPPQAGGPPPMGNPPQAGGPQTMLFTGKPQFVNDITNADGTHTVTLTGDVVWGDEPVLCVYRVTEPARFAETALVLALQERGVSARFDLKKTPDFAALSQHYKAEQKVAEIVSPPLAEELMPMMKLSSNLHAAAWPYIVGAIAGGDRQNARMKGFEIQKDLYAKTGVETDIDFLHSREIDDVQYQPQSFINFLRYLQGQPYFSEYLRSLAVLGAGGTGSAGGDAVVGASAAGHVYAKTGGSMRMVMSPGSDKPTGSVARALAGYMALPGGRLVLFAVFAAHDTDNPEADGTREALGEIVTIMYEAWPPFGPPAVEALGRIVR